MSHYLTTQSDHYQTNSLPVVIKQTTTTQQLLNYENIKLFFTMLHQQTTTTITDTMSTLEAMRLQETSYSCQDYLQQALTQSQHSFVQGDSEFTQDDVTVCQNNRSKMVEWMMTLTDACQLKRDTVSIAMNNMDRYLATPQGMTHSLRDSSAFQLACMTSLYSAIKVHEEKALSPEVLSSISRGFYSKKDMEDMEWSMLNALQWRVNGPTPLAFVREYLANIPRRVMKDSVKEHVLALAMMQTELAVTDYNMSTSSKASSIAFAALTNAMDVLGLEFRIVNHYILAKSNLVDICQVCDVQSALFVAVAGVVPSAAAARQQQRSTSMLCTQQQQQASKQHGHSSISPRTVLNEAA